MIRVTRFAAVRTEDEGVCTEAARQERSGLRVRKCLLKPLDRLQALSEDMLANM